MQKVLSSNDISLNFSCILGHDVLIIDSMDGTEEISKPFLYKLTVHSLNKEIKCDKLLGTEASLSLTLDGKTRNFSGIIGCIDQLETREGSDGLLYVFYELHLHPKLWLLTFTKDYRIFQNQYVSDIITHVLQENGVTQIDNRTSNMGKSKREFCVQYDESCFDFISRLMEEEGIGYSFAHLFGQHTMILMDQNNDGNKAYKDLPMSQSVLSDTPSMNQVTFLRRQHNVVASNYKASNYNYMAPSMPLRSSVSGDGIGGTIYEYPASFHNLKTSEHVASVRINEIEWPKNTIFGKSTAPLLSEASIFTLTEHPSDDANITYFIYAITHQITRIPTHEKQSNSKNDNHSDGRINFLQNPRSSTLLQTIYDNNFSAIPNNIIFTPIRKTKKPKIHSNQTAVVVGPAGEEVYCDNLGRIKVQFHWDTRGTFDTNSSCWVRVSQNWASAGWGGLVIPRVGMEVIVTFIDGNPDMPLVIGCVYNADNSPPNSVVTNPTKSAFKTNSTRKNGCYNELSIDDAKGKEKISVKAAKDMDVAVAGNYALTLTDGDCTTTLAHGNVNTMVAQGNKALTLRAGDYIINLENGGLTIQAAGDISIAAGGTLNLSGNNINLNAHNSINIAAPNKVDISGGMLVTVDFPGKLPTFPMDSAYVAASAAQAALLAAMQKAEADKAEAEEEAIEAAERAVDRAEAQKAIGDLAAAQKAETNRIAAEEAAARAADKAAAQKALAELASSQKAETERIAAENAKARAADKAAADLAAQKAENNRIAAVAAAQAAAQKAASDKAAADKIAADLAAAQKAESDRIAAAAAAQAAAQKAASDKVAADKIAADLAAAQKAENDRIAAVAAAQAIAQKIATGIAAAQKAAARAVADKAASDKAASDKAAADKAAADKTAADKAAADKASADKAAADKAAADKAAADKAAADKTAADKTAADKAAADKAAADKAAA
ncbi:MAG: type VI secretion system tip protein TssI/VgrG, partial [Pseudomonadota bacterium]